MFKYFFLGLLLVILAGVASVGFLDLTPPAKTTKKVLNTD